MQRKGMVQQDRCLIHSIWRLVKRSVSVLRMSDIMIRQTGIVAAWWTCECGGQYHGNQDQDLGEETALL